MSGCAYNHSVMTLCVYSGLSRNKDMLKLGSVIMWQGVAGTSQALQELRRRCNKLRPCVHCCMISCFRRHLLFFRSCCRWGEQDIAIPVAGTLPAREQSPLWGLSPRPYAYEAHALPAELRRQVLFLWMRPSSLVHDAMRILRMFTAQGHP